MGAAREWATGLRVQLEHAVSHYPEDPAVYLPQLIADLDRVRERARAVAATADEADAAHKTLRDALRARTAAADVIERLRAPVTSDPSNVDSATTDATAPGAPTGLTATANGSSQIDLSWTAPSDTGGAVGGRAAGARPRRLAPVGLGVSSAT